MSTRLEAATTMGAQRSDVPLSLREMPGLSDAAWDQLIAQYDNATVFHSSPWHRCLNATLPGEVIRFQIEAGGDVCGHWCGFMVRKFGVKVFGAPLPGTATDYMHPLFSTSPPAGEFLKLVQPWAASRRVSMIELGGEYFDDTTLAGAGYEVKPTRTYRVDLSSGEAAVWSRLKPAMRNKVRKAEKNGVVVVEDRSPDFPARFHDMLRAVFNRQGIAPTYTLERIETVVRILGASGQLVPLMALRENEPLAGVILLLDRQAAYYWAGASYQTAYPVAANDIIQWRALQIAMERGLTVYDACGGGDYKEKFGGSFVSLPAGHVSMNPVFGLIRTSVSKGFRAKQALLGALQRATAGRR